MKQSVHKCHHRRHYTAVIIQKSVHATLRSINCAAKPIPMSDQQATFNSSLLYMMCYTSLPARSSTTRNKTDGMLQSAQKLSAMCIFVIKY